MGCLCRLIATWLGTFPAIGVSFLVVGGMDNCINLWNLSKFIKELEIDFDKNYHGSVNV